MELHKHAFALGVAKTMGVIYILCAIFVKIAPEISTRLMGYVTHLVNLKIQDNVVVTLRGTIVGLVEVFVLTYIGAWLFAWLINKHSKTQPH